MDLNKLERKFGKYAISNLSLWMIITYVIGYGVQIVASNLIGYLVLDPYLIIHKFQIWRIVSWILIPPEGLGIFTIIMLFLYYSLGTTLEKTWGTFKYNVYIFSGLIFTVIGAFLIYGIGAVTGWFGFSYYGIQAGSQILSYSFSTYYINLSIFFAFAACYPDMQLLLYFIIPIKIKWLALVDGVFILIDFVNNGAAGRMTIIVSLLNFIVFFLSTRNAKHVSPQEIRRRQAYKQAVRPAGTGTVTKHKCAICGRTEKDGEDLEFRFCSKCDGNYEYCQEHLFTHEHIKKS